MGIPHSQFNFQRPQVLLSSNERAHFTINALWSFIASSVQRTVEISFLSAINQHLYPHLLGPCVTYCASCWEEVKDDMPNDYWNAPLVVVLWFMGYGEKCSCLQISIWNPFAETIKADQSEMLEQWQMDRRLRVINEQLCLITEMAYKFLVSGGF